MTPTKKRFLVSVVTIALILFVVPLIDRIWFTYSVPSGFTYAQWGGTWSSDEHWLVSGLVLAKLPGAIPENKDFKMEAFVYYRIWSIYRPGTAVRIPMIGHMATGEAVGGESESRNDFGSPSIAFRFESSTGLTAHSTESLLPTTDEAMVGEYRSQDPADTGRFTLSRIFNRGLDFP